MTTCPKCGETSGNSWEQCEGECPMPMSPRYTGLPARYIRVWVQDGVTFRVEGFDADPDDIARFMSYVDKLPGGCWYWAGARSRGKGNKKWYGSFYCGGKVYRAHRWAAVNIGGQRELQKGEHRDHTCHFSMCVNPAHLEIVTHEENQLRKMRRKKDD